LAGPKILPKLTTGENAKRKSIGNWETKTVLSLHEVPRISSNRPPSSIFRCSIGTSTERKNVELAISQHDLSKYFLGAACSEDVSRGKPDPEVFLEAAKILSITPKNCVVFEDSPHGIEAAKRAGMKTVALTTTHPSTTFMHLNPDLLVASLADLGIDQVEKLFS